MNTRSHLARAKAKAKFQRIRRWGHGKARNTLRGKPKNGPLIVATGPGSINAESEMRQLVLAGRDKEAAQLYERHMNVYYKAGRPQMRWGSEWYAQHKRDAA